MRFWKKWRRSEISVDDLKKAEMLEAYTCWLKNQKLSRKQKYLLEEFNNSPELQSLKRLIDFAHYRFEERENVEPRLGAQDRARNRVMAEIRGEETDTNIPVGHSAANPAYSPPGMGDENTEIMQMGEALPNVDELPDWGSEKSSIPSAMLNRHDDLRALSRLHVQFEQEDDNVYVTDLGSSNTTYVNDEQIAMSTPVREGSTLRCGKISFKIVDIERS